MDRPVRRNIVISAVNLRKGGTLTVLRKCLYYLSTRSDLHVTALVHKRELCDFKGIDYIEIPWSSGSWPQRLWCEYITMNRISKQLPKTDLWLSLHDTTPRVKASRQAVYCHNSFPFMKPRLRDWQMDYKIPLFSLFSRFAYRWNVHSNHYLVCQQNWMRERLSQMLHFDKERIIVAPASEQFKASAPSAQRQGNDVFTFIYPATADCHKNFETACSAARILEQRIGPDKFRLILTISGTENRYSRFLNERYGDISNIDFHGLMPQKELFDCYSKADCLVFPSRTETWGLPISEFLSTGKPMILADLPYAHETASGAGEVAFFDTMNANELADRMQDIIEGRLEHFVPVPADSYSKPYAQGWDSLFDLLLK